MADEPSTAPAPQEDTAAHPTQVVRTFAQDVATLSGKTLVKDAPEPRAEPAETAPARKRKVKEPPPAYIIPKAPSTNETREAVLDRLRAKIAAAGPAPDESVAAVEPEPKIAAPESSPYPARPAVAEEKPAEPERLHTYKSDFADRIDEQQASTFSVLAAQADAAPTATVSIPEKRPFPIAIVSGVALLVLGAGAVYAAYALVSDKPVVPEEEVVPSLVFSNAHQEVSGTGSALQEALRGAETAALGEGDVLITYVTTVATSSDGMSTTTVPAPGGALIAALDLPAPAILLRSIDPPSTVGIVRAADESRPFFILQVSSFERSFAGMLDWEARMADDLATLYPPYSMPAEEAADESATTTASTTPTVPTPAFADAVVDNHDVRVLRGADGRAIIIYGYRDKKTLVIARNEAAFREILGRLSTARGQ